MQHASTKQPSNLSMYIPKKVGDRGNACLNPILQLISSNIVLRLGNEFLTQPFTNDSHLERNLNHF